MRNALVRYTPYALHFLGAGGGRRLVAGTLANPDAPAVNYVNADQVAANRSIFYGRDGAPLSAGAVMQSFARSFGSGGQPVRQAQGSGLNPGRSQQAAQSGDDDPSALAPQASLGTSPRGNSLSGLFDPRADMPAEGSREAQFVIPPGPAGFTSLSGNGRSVPGGLPTSSDPAAAPGATRAPTELPSSDPNARNPVPTLGGGGASGRTMQIPGVELSAPRAPSGPISPSTMVAGVPAGAIMAAPTGQRIQALQRALLNPNTPDGVREFASTMLKQSLDETKLPPEAKEYVFAKAHGWTQARSPAEYAGEVAEAKRGPQSVSPGSSLVQNGRVVLTVPDRDRDEGAKILAGAAARRQIVLDQGGNPDDPGMQVFIRTGKDPKEAAPFSASDKKVITQAEDQALQLDQTIDTLNRAKELNGQTYTGYGAKALGYTGTAFPGAGMVLDPKKAEATREFGAIMSMEAIKAMSSTLKGATTDREMDRFVEILGDPTTPPSIRANTIDRMLALAQRQRETKDAERALGAGVIGGALGAGGGYILDKAVPVVSRLFARNAPFRGSDGALTDQASVALREAGIDPAAITPELAQHIETVFSARGPSPAAAREAQAAEFALPLSRGQATQDSTALALEGRALAGRTGPRAQQIGDEFAGRQADAVAANRDRFLGMAAGDAPRIENPREAFEAAADRARQAAAAETERQSIATRGVDDALRAVRGRGDVDALDGAVAAAQGVRDAAAASKAGYRTAYDDVAQIPGQFAPGALDRLGSRVRERLGTDVPLDPVLTPAANRAIGDLDDVPGLFGLAPGEGPNLQQVEQLRRRILAYRGSTGQNPTDRRAVDRILSELDSHAEDAAAAGLFGPRQAAGPRDTTGDGFPGFAGPGATPADGGAAARLSEPETLVGYLARTGGVPLDGEARAGDLHKTYIPGHGTLARTNAPTWDQRRVHLMEEGFLPPGMDGTASARDVADWARDAIRAERTGGRVTVRLGEEGGIGGRRAAETIEAQNADHAAMVDWQARRMAIDLEGYGIGARDIDRDALDHAAEQVVLGRHTVDAVDAYEAALSRPAGQGRQGPVASEVPFDGPTGAAVTDALPVGDTGPLDAMRRARGLFRDHQQAFRPRGPGDVAGQRLQRIVERDASPNEVAGMLFGSPGTGRIQAGQLQTLARVRDAVGADSEAWRETQRALIARHLGGEGRDLGQRLDYLLRGEGRGLTTFLSEEQRQGLGRLRGAVARSEAAGAPMPTWASDLERSGFDPNAVGRSIFGGSGALGAKPGAANEALAAKAFLGAESAEWAGLRQAAIHRLMDPETPALRMVANLRDFTGGTGKGVAEALFAPAELGHLRRFAAALQSTVRPDETIKPGADGEARRRAVAKIMDVIAGAIAFKAAGLPAAAGVYGAKVGQRAIVGGFGARAARQSFEGGAPRTLAAPPMLPLGQLATGEGLGLGQR